MDRSKVAWFAMGLLVGLGVLLGAGMQDAKTPGRYQVVETRRSIAPDLISHDALLVDTSTGFTCRWLVGKTEDGYGYSYWSPIKTIKEEVDAEAAWRKNGNK